LNSSLRAAVMPPPGAHFPAIFFGAAGQPTHHHLPIHPADTRRDADWRRDGKNDCISGRFTNNSSGIISLFCGGRTAPDTVYNHD